MSTLPRILCVDDEENILKSIVRSLRKHWDIVTAPGGREALRLLEEADEPFPVIVSDMRMPEMNGAQFLEEARRIHPDSVRLLLTGYADLEAVVAAVNKGHIFRFLSKPCPVEMLHAALRDALRQYELVNAERILLERTLKGSIRAMTDILAVASPEAFGHAERVRRQAADLAARAGLGVDWQLEVAAMLAQLGCVTLPPDTVSRHLRGDTLAPQEQEMVARIPAVTCEILGNIPRLGPVLEMLRQGAGAADGAGDPERARRVRGLLRLVGDAERLRAGGWSGQRVLDWLRANRKDYDGDLLRLYEETVDLGAETDPVRGVKVREMRVGMVLVEDVRTETGLLLVAAGQEVSVGLLERINNFHNTNGLKEPLWVRTPDDVDTATPNAADLLAAT